MKYLLGLDVSTTATKALLVSEEGQVVASSSSTYELSTPRPLWAEQDPELWWRASQLSIRSVIEKSGIQADSVAGIGLTGQMHGLVLLDGKGSVLRPAILWNDQRSSAQCERIRQYLGLEKLVQITGNDAFPGFTAPKLIWVRENESAIYDRARHVLLPKDYVRYRLTGQLGTDRAGAGGTLMLDLESRQWSAELLEALEISSDLLPPCHEGTEITGRIDADAAQATGLAIDTPVVGGGGDQAAQAVGVGAIDPGTVALTLGTSGVVFAGCDRPLVEKHGRLHAFPHAVPERWHVMGVMLSAAGSLQWYRDKLTPGVAFEDLMGEADRVDPGCEGLLFLPYLSGERTPHADPTLRGGFSGLTLRHERPHLTRSVLEGVAFGLRDNLALMASVGIDDVREIRISGGGTKSPVWRQILADVLEVELISVETLEGAAFGAALLAGVGAEIWPSAQEASERAVILGGRTTPRQENLEIYREAYERFRRHYPALAPLYRL